MSLDDSLHIPGGSGVEGSSLVENYLGQERRRAGTSSVVTVLDPQAQRWEGLWHMQGVPGVCAGKAVRG